VLRHAGTLSGRRRVLRVQAPRRARAVLVRGRVDDVAGGSISLERRVRVRRYVVRR
jgi:hypothetical protein